MIDTHSHLYSPDFEEDLQAVIDRCKAISIEKLYLPAIDSSTHDAMMALAAAQPGWCIPMMGLHPCYVTANYQQPSDSHSYQEFNGRMHQADC